VIEKALVGWKAIAEFLDWTLSKTMKYVPELHKEGLILATLKGRPPNRRRVIFTFPDLLKLWALERFRSKRG